MKRKLFAFLIVLMMILPLCAGAAADGASLLCEAEQAADGSYDAVIRLNGAEDAAMMQFTLYYDPARISVLSAELGNIFAGNQTPMINTGISGEIRLIWDSLRPLNASGAVLVLRLQKNDPGDALLSFDADEVILAREDFTDIDLRCADCLIEGAAPEPAAASQITPFPEAAAPTAPPAVLGAAATPASASLTPAAASTSAAASPAPAAASTPAAASPAPAAASTPAAASPTPAAASTSASASPAPAAASTPAAELRVLEEAASTAQPAATKRPASEETLRQGSSEGLTLAEYALQASAGETKTVVVLEDEPKLSWTSSNEKVATVDENGVVTTHEKGTAVITVSREDGSAFASSVLTVEAAPEPAPAAESDKPALTGEARPSASPAKAEEKAESAPAGQPTPAASPAETGESGEEPAPAAQKETNQGKTALIVLAAAAICGLFICLTKRRRKK